MVSFRCHKTVKEHLQVWVQKPRSYRHFVLEDLMEVAAESLGVDIFFRPENLPDSKYFKRAESYLLEKGDKKAVVRLIRQNGKILQGSVRIPLKVSSKRQVFVIKPYDEYNPELEREVLQRVSGKLAPRVLHFGSEFYSEELVDFKRYTDLFTRAIATGAFGKEKVQELWDYCFGKNAFDYNTRDKLMQEMAEKVAGIVREGGTIHGKLAQLGVVYSHNHWLDEFHTADGCEPVITDFGTSYLFITPEEVEADLKKSSAELEQMDESPETRDAYFALSDRVDRMSKFEQGYRMTNRLPARFWDLKGERREVLEQDRALAVNLDMAMQSSWEGISSFFEEVAVGSGLDYTNIVWQDFQDGFMEGYFS